LQNKETITSIEEERFTAIQFELAAANSSTLENFWRKKNQKNPPMSSTLQGPNLSIYLSLCLSTTFVTSTTSLPTTDKTATFPQNLKLS
jgi:hypothetical protein